MIQTLRKPSGSLKDVSWSSKNYFYETSIAKELVLLILYGLWQGLKFKNANSSANKFAKQKEEEEENMTIFTKNHGKVPATTNLVHNILV